MIRPRAVLVAALLALLGGATARAEISLMLPAPDVGALVPLAVPALDKPPVPLPAVPLPPAPQGMPELPPAPMVATWASARWLRCPRRASWPATRWATSSAWPPS